MENNFSDQELIPGGRERHSGQQTQNTESGFAGEGQVDLYHSEISHSILTPLNAILGITRIFGRTKLNSDQKNYLKSLEDSVRILKVQ